jgi:reverse transcriptase-like protein
MRNILARSLPIQLGTRLVLDSVSYSSPLPPWADPVTINYATRETRIRNKITKYLNGENPPPPFEIGVPKKVGGKKSWKIPSVNDQIVAQVCVSALAEKVYGALDGERVLSYRYNTNADRLQLTESQVSSWRQFQDETDRKLTAHSHLLQIDLEDAFESIDRVKFFDFLEHLAPKRVEVLLLRRMLESFSRGDAGLPLVNDSVFFMGNAYLRLVDQAIGKYSTNFIRFVDDYRIFGSSSDHLEGILQQISQELAPLGFKINKSKVKLGSNEEYLEAIAHDKYATTKENEEGYISATAFDDVTTPNLLLNLITRALQNPKDLLTEGFGRLSLGAIRRIRLNHEVVVEGKGYKSSPWEEYQDRLSKNDDLVKRALDLLEMYLKDADESWRVVWLLYMLDDVDSPHATEARSQPRKQELLQSASTIGSTEVVRLWARKALAGKEPGEVEELHELGYLEGGGRYYGRQNS